MVNERSLLTGGTEPQTPEFFGIAFPTTPPPFQLPPTEPSPPVSNSPPDVPIPPGLRSVPVRDPSATVSDEVAPNRLEVASGSRKGPQLKPFYERAAIRIENEAIRKSKPRNQTIIVCKTC